MTMDDKNKQTNKQQQQQQQSESDVNKSGQFDKTRK